MPLAPPPPEWEKSPKHSPPRRVDPDMAASITLNQSALQPSAQTVALEHDAQLMLRVRAGDMGCFAQLLDRHRNPVIHYLYRMVHNQAVAEELAQEVFLRVYKARDGYEATAKFTTWLYRIATRLALNWIRDTKNEKNHDSLDEEVLDGAVRQVADRQASVEQVMVTGAKMEQVRRAVQHLPAKQRAAVLMHKYQELDYSQIAQVLECSESAVKSVLFRAYETLRARLAHLQT